MFTIEKNRLCAAVQCLQVSSVSACASVWAVSSVTHAGPCTMDQLVKTKSSSCYPPGSHTAVHRTLLCVCVCVCVSTGTTPEWHFTNPGDWPNDVPCLTKSKHQEVVERGKMGRIKAKQETARERKRSFSHFILLITAGLQQRPLWMNVAWVGQYSISRRAKKMAEWRNRSSR